MQRYLPIKFCLQDDELLYSWGYRLYKANLLNSKREMEKMFLRGQAMHADGFSLSRDLFLATGFNTRQLEIFEKHTLYPFFAIFYNEQKQDKVLGLQRMGFKKYSSYSPIEDNLKKLNYCPECIKEDRRVNLKRSHQLPGVSVCYKHKCKLISLEKNYKGEELEDIDLSKITTDYKISDRDLAYANFMKDILEASFDLDLYGLSEMISKRISDLNLKDRDSLIDYFNEKGSKIRKNQATVLLRTPELMSEEFLQNNLYTLFSEIETFKSYYEKLDINGFDEVFYKKLEKSGYLLLSPFKNNLLEIFHKDCSVSFLITDYALKAGLRCPDCQKLNPKELYDLLFKAYAKDEFTLLSSYENASTPVKIKHSCGNVFEAKPNMFYFNSMGCNQCLSRLSLEDAQKKVDEVDKDYEVLEYEALDKKAVFYHKVCGKTVERRFSDFLRKKMSCPHCKEQERLDSLDDFEKMKKDIVGDNYEIISEFDGNRRPIKLRHKSCGLTTEYIRADFFLKGQRCPLCSSKITNDELKDYIDKRTLGTYRLIETLPQSKVKILNNKTNEDIVLKKNLLLQELERDTKSEILDCQKDARVKRPLSSLGKFLEKLKNAYPNKSFSIDELINLGYKKSQARSYLKKLLDYGVVEKRNNEFMLKNMEVDYAKNER